MWIPESRKKTNSRTYGDRFQLNFQIKLSRNAMGYLRYEVSSADVFEHHTQPSFLMFT